MPLDKSQIAEIIDRALEEDLSKGDVTTEVLIPVHQQGVAFIIAKQEGILAGLDVAKQVLQRVDPGLRVDILLQDGARVKPGDRIARIEGKLSSILSAERVTLNFLQHLSGIATMTNQYVESVRGLPVQIMDTRKTTPGLRLLEKYAVRVGGGKNHRMSLGDAILIKDNHLAALRQGGLGIKEAITKAKQNLPRLQQAKQPKIEVEVKTIAEALEAVEAGADIVMLDNMSLEEMREAVRAIRGRALVEASGGVTLDNVRAVAETGVDFISVGALTHSAKALDISLEVE